MELASSQRKTVEHQFDSFCKKMLRNEARDCRRYICHKKKHEVLFSEMTKKEIDELMTVDKYPTDINKFKACGFEVDIESDLLSKALSILPVKSRAILLLAYFLDMSDPEIAVELNMMRRTVQHQRSTSLTKLKKYMGGKTDEKE